MLYWFVLFMIVVYLLACATVITTSCYHLIKKIRWTPTKRKPFPRTISV